MDTLCFDIGGTAIKYCVFDINNNEKFRNQIMVDQSLGGISIIKILNKTIDEMKEKFRIDGLSIAAPGNINPLTGAVVRSSGTIKNYTNLSFFQQLNHHNLKMTIDNDVNLSALAEAKARNVKHLFMINIGTGVGGGYINNDSIVQGDHFNAANIGSLRYQGEMLDDLASTRGLLIRTGKKSGEELVASLRSGEAEVVRHFDQFFETLAETIYTIHQVVDVHEVVIGGGISEAGDILIQGIKNGLKMLTQKYEGSFECNLSAAVYGNKAGTYGALENYRSKYKND